MPTKKELATRLNQLLSLQVDFARLNKDSLKKLTSAYPYEFEERRIEDLERLEEVVEESGHAVYSTPFDKYEGEYVNFLIQAIDDGILYTYSKVLPPHFDSPSPEDNQNIEVGVLGETVELIYNYTEHNMGPEEARNENKEKITKIIEEKFPDLKHGKIHTDGDD